MLGFQFLATFVARRVLGKDENYMPSESKGRKRGGMSLDDTEGFFMALAEGQKRNAP